MSTLASTIRSSRVLRRVLFRVLKDRLASRALPDGAGRLWFPAGRNLNLFLSRTGVVEPQITGNLRRLVRRDDLVFDVGANIGYYTVLFSHWAAEGRVVAVEPDRDNLPVLRMNIERNGLARTELVAAALSDQEGAGTLFQDPNTGRTSSLEADAWHPIGPEEIVPTKVPLTTLDTLTERFGIPRLIKCDVEGHEVAVLHGATRTLRARPIWMLEVQGKNRPAVAALLADAGYVFFPADQPLGGQPATSISVENVFAIHRDLLSDLRAW